MTALILQLSLCLVYLFASRTPAWMGRDLGLKPSGLVDSVAFAEWFFHGLVAVALIRFRRTPEWKRLPLTRLAPYVYVGLSVWIVSSNLIGAEFAEIWLGLTVVGAGILASLWVLRPRLQR